MNMVRIAAGTYETADAAFRITFNNEVGMWMLLQLDAEGQYQWCQSYCTLRDAKQGAQWINRSK